MVVPGGTTERLPTKGPVASGDDPSATVWLDIVVAEFPAASDHFAAVCVVDVPNATE